MSENFSVDYRKAMPNSPAHPFIYLSREQQDRCERWVNNLVMKEVFTESQIEHVLTNMREGRIRTMDLWKLENASRANGMPLFGL